MKTNDRFDRLTNLDISTHHRGGTRWLHKSDLLSSFAHWVVAQSPYDAPDITPALTAWDIHLATRTAASARTRSGWGGDLDIPMLMHHCGVVAVVQTVLRVQRLRTPRTEAEREMR